MFRICQEYNIKTGIYPKTAKLIQANISKSGQYELRFQMTMCGMPSGQWVCMEDAFLAMLKAGDIIPIQKTECNLPDDLFKL